MVVAEFSPLSGYEPKYSPKKYNKTRRTRESLNCFAYAFDYMELPPLSQCSETECNVPYHQPGYASGYPKWKDVKVKKCSDLFARLRGDVPGLIAPVKFKEKCPKGTSKIFLNKTRKNLDYHFGRQDSSGYWSHKPGGTEVTNKDASGKLIIRPDKADWDYRKKGSDLNYQDFCGYLCVPRKSRLRFKRGGKQKTRKNLHN